MRRFLVLLLLFASTLHVRLGAQDALQPELSADQSEYDDRTREAIFRGHARAIYGEIELTAEEIRWHQGTRIVTALRQAVLTAGGRRLLADKVTYRLADGTYFAENLRLGEYPIYLRGASAEGNRTQLVVHHATASLREPGPWAPTLVADTLTYKFGERLQAERAHLGIGPIRPFALPHFDHHLKEPLRSYFSLFGGYRGSLGAFVEVGMRLPVSSSVNLGADLGVYSARGVMAGPAGDYAWRDGAEQEIWGRFRSGYINDHGDKKTDVLHRAVPEERSYFAWDHRQRINAHLTLDGTFNYWRDSEILRDFKPASFFPVQTPDSYVESVYTGDNYHVSLFTRFQPNHYHAVQERLPELRYDLLPLALPGGFYERFQASAAVLRDDVFIGSRPTLRSDRVDAYYALTRPISPREWLSLNPVVGGRMTHYARTNPGSGRDDYTRWLGEVGADAQLRTSASFDYKNETWKIDGLRHLLTPRLSYRYIPEAGRGRRYIPVIDRRTFSSYLPPLGLGDTRNLDDLHATNTLRVGFDNTLQTRDPVYGSRDLAVLNVANDFRFARQPGERDVSETHLQLGLMPAHWVRFDLYQSVAPQNLHLRELNTGLTLHDGDAWSLQLATHYLAGDINEYGLDYRRRINEVYEAYTRLRFDSRRHRFNEREFGVWQNLDNTWFVRYSVTLYSGPRRESSFGFHVEVQAHGF
ncbi:MAG: LPS-assembly protein LptD [Opitutae bacterium]|nr:LPS-assembly protein LptD [Opitutae bacterium]